MDIQNLINFNYTKKINRSDFNLNFSSFNYTLQSNSKINNQIDNHSVPIAAEFKDDFLVVGEENGVINLLKTENMINLLKFQAHNNLIFDVKFRPDYVKHLLTASGDKSLIIWDLSQEKQLIKLDSGHNSSIKAINFFNSNVFASGGRDGYIRLWDLRSETKQIQSIKDAHRNKFKAKKNTRKILERSDPNSVVTSLIFGTDNYLYSSGANDGCIKIWDIRNLKPNKFDQIFYVNKLDYCGLNQKAEGYTSLALDSLNCLYASCSDNKIYSYDYKLSLGSKPESQYVKCFKGAAVTNYTKIKILNDDLLISGSNNSEVCIWSIKESKKNYYNYPKITLPHDVEEVSVITCDDWRYDIYSCDDNTMLYKWSVNSLLNDKSNNVKSILKTYENENEINDHVVLDKKIKHSTGKISPLSSLNNWISSKNKQLNSNVKKNLNLNLSEKTKPPILIEINSPVKTKRNCSSPESNSKRKKLLRNDENHVKSIPLTRKCKKMHIHFQNANKSIHDYFNKI